MLTKMSEITKGNARARQAALYDELWRHRAASAGSPDLIRYRVWARHLRSPIVDIGAGDGLLARSFPDYEIYSIDLSTTGLSKVVGRAAAAAAEALPLRDGVAATLVLSEVLEHVEDPLGVLAQCRRVLQGDGRLLLSVPLWPLARTESLHHRRRIGTAPSLANLSRWDPNHERRFTRDELVKLITVAGWTVEQEVRQFGEWAAFGFYWLEPAMSRLTGRQHRVAHRLAALDRARGRSSGLSLVLRPKG